MWPHESCIFLWCLSDYIYIKMWSGKGGIFTYDLGYIFSELSFTELLENNMVPYWIFRSFLKGVITHGILANFHQSHPSSRCRCHKSIPPECTDRSYTGTRCQHNPRLSSNIIISCSPSSFVIKNLWLYFSAMRSVFVVWVRGLAEQETCVRVCICIFLFMQIVVWLKFMRTHR